MLLLEERQALRILGQMGPYSVKKLLEAVEAGRVDGGSYARTIYEDDIDRVSCANYNYLNEFYEDTGKRVEETVFAGCLLGWGGFLEHTSYPEMKKAMQEKYGRYSPDDGGTDEIECFVAGIHLGDTPENNEDVAELRDLILDYLAGNKKPVPLDTEEKLFFVRRFPSFTDSVFPDGLPEERGVTA